MWETTEQTEAGETDWLTSACESGARMWDWWGQFLRVVRLRTVHLERVCIPVLFCVFLWNACVSSNKQSVVSALSSTATCCRCLINASGVRSNVSALIWTERYCTCAAVVHTCGLDCGPFLLRQCFLSFIIPKCTAVVAIVDIPSTCSCIKLVLQEHLRLHSFFWSTGQI